MITSHQNEQIKTLRKLQQKRNRERLGFFAAEGEDLVNAALSAGWEPETIFCTELAPEEFLGHEATEVVQIDVLDAAVSLGSGTRVVGVFGHRWSDPGDADLSVYLDGVADPGNIGTILRSALAFSDGPAILGPGCADPFSPKAVRASMGALFTRPPARADLSELTATKIALDGDAPKTLRELQTSGPAIICIGAERDGLSAAAFAGADLRARIPMRQGGPDSLNAAIATSIALYELAGEVQTTVHAQRQSSPVTGVQPPAEK
ncbi:MAG: RNA methyltransferase [Solirubrobacterales bacterium]